MEVFDLALQDAEMLKSTSPCEVSNLAVKDTKEMLKRSSTTNPCEVTKSAREGVNRLVPLLLFAEVHPLIPFYLISPLSLLPPPRFLL